MSRRARHALVLVAFILSMLGATCIPCGYTDPRSCLFYWEYGHWPIVEEPKDAGP